MQSHDNQHLILDKYEFREVMLEAKELIEKAKRLKYNLMHENSLDLYNMWSPYVLGDISFSYVNAPGFKIAFMQVMSIVMAMRDEKEDNSDNINKIEERENVINFLSYKSTKNSENIYQTTNVKV